MQKVERSLWLYATHSVANNSFAAEMHIRNRDEVVGNHGITIVHVNRTA
jgi:hypothetical protein